MKEKLSIAVEEDKDGEVWARVKRPKLEELAERIEEEVLDKYKVEEGNEEAFGGRGAPLEWRKSAHKEETQR